MTIKSVAKVELIDKKVMCYYLVRIHLMELIYGGKNIKELYHRGRNEDTCNKHLNPVNSINTVNGTINGTYLSIQGHQLFSCNISAPNIYTKTDVDSALAETKQQTEQQHIYRLRHSTSSGSIGTQNLVATNIVFQVMRAVELLS